MKNIVNIILLSPVLVYVVLLFVNIDLLQVKEKVNIFWIWEVNVSVILFISIFFVLYIFLMYFSGKFFTFFINSKNKSLEEEKVKLKAELSDKIPEIEKKMEEKFDEFIEKMKDINSKNLELHKKETSKVLGNLEFEIKSLNTRG